MESLAKGVVGIDDIIAPSAMEEDFSYVRLNDRYVQVLFVAGYPRYVSPNWLMPLITFNHTIDISMHIVPVEGKTVLDDLRRKVAEMEAEMANDIQQGKAVDPGTQAKLEDAKVLQEQLVKGVERFFMFGLYIAVYSTNLKELKAVSEQVISTLGSIMIVAKKATLQIMDGFETVLPIGQDRIDFKRNMDTTSLATTFPFTSSELSDDRGVAYGINEHNESLVIFDRFSLENANMTVFATSGAGKSYAVKLEILRSLLFDTSVLVIDPEDEYRLLASVTQGNYFDFTQASVNKINPFDLTVNRVENEDVLSQKIMFLHALMEVIMGKLTPEEGALLDRAIVQTYKMKGITPDPSTQNSEAPLMEDLYKVLLGYENKMGQSLALRMERFVKGGLAGIFNARSNIEINAPLTVFSIKGVEDELRPVAMFIILNFIWDEVRKRFKKRLLVVDEAWYLMQYPGSAKFLRAVVKRARKYYLGVTTITQDVEDFLASPYGSSIINNSAIQFLMKQSPPAIDKVAKTFYLSRGERRLLLSADVGEGIFFAGSNHVALRVVASPEEHKIITTKPEEVSGDRLRPGGDDGGGVV
ncbi:MAG: DUF87 domain-containing protein [bacterium]|nr:DUF87 domain-containing protein [bacterium]